MSDTTKKPLPDYEKPPVVEVVSGIQFRSINDLTGAHLGLLWEKFKLDYPRVREVEPLAPAIESFAEVPERVMASFVERFALSRTWFETTDGNGLIQVQRDRFLHNWRKEKDTDQYPHYDYVIGSFRGCLAKFEQFLEERKLGEIEPRQYELTYVNHIFKGEGWETFDDIRSVFQDFCWRERREAGKRFLPVPEGVHWQTSFVLPERAGRLHVSIRLGKRKTDGVPAILLEITARGMSANHSRSSMWSWFDMAREWIVCGFSDLTTEEIQTKVWRRKR